MKKTTMLRNLLKEPGLLVVPCVQDCLTARCAEAVGFKSIFVAGSSMRDVVFGLPSIGTVTATEVVNLVKYIANSVNIPLIVDADDGYGGMLSAYRTTLDVIKSGAAGITISDKKLPFLATPLNTAPHGIGEVLSREEYLGKIGAVLEVRDREDKDFIIVARIEAGPILGDDEVIARAKSCLELGVDIILPFFKPIDSKSKELAKENLRELFNKIGISENVIWGMGPDEFTAVDYREIGAKMWVNGRIDFIVAEAVLDFYQRFHDTGMLPARTFRAQPGEGTSGNYLSKLRGIDAWIEVENRNARLG